MIKFGKKKTINNPFFIFWRESDTKSMREQRRERERKKKKIMSRQNYTEALPLTCATL